MDIDSDLVDIMFKELGKNSADLFVEFYQGFPRSEQVDGARSILTATVGKPRTDDLFNQLQKKS